MSIASSISRWPVRMSMWMLVSKKAIIEIGAPHGPRGAAEYRQGLQTLFFFCEQAIDQVRLSLDAAGPHELAKLTAGNPHGEKLVWFHHDLRMTLADICLTYAGSVSSAIRTRSSSGAIGGAFAFCVAAFAACGTREAPTKS
jgi:hypothetical protein